MAQSFDAELANLEALAHAEPSSTRDALSKALRHRNNFIVAKAAKLVVDHQHLELAPELTQAFDRFLKDPVKTDPQCWAKNALLRALSDMAYQEPDLFLTGMRHIQMEPVWGGTSDTAGTLRGLSAMGLVQCRSLSNLQVLTHLTQLFADKELPVRVNAARAVERIGTDAAILLLRLRAELGSDAPELLGACYSAVLHLEGPSAIPWAAAFLHPLAPDDASAEAAFHILQNAWKKTRDQDFRATLLSAIAQTRQDAAWEFLLEQAAEGSPSAREALEHSAAPANVLARL